MSATRGFCRALLVTTCTATAVAAGFACTRSGERGANRVRPQDATGTAESTPSEPRRNSRAKAPDAHPDSSGSLAGIPSALASDLPPCPEQPPPPEGNSRVCVPLLCLSRGQASAVLRTRSRYVELSVCLDSECDVLHLPRPSGTDTFSTSKQHGKRFHVEGKWSPYAVDLRIRFSPIGRAADWANGSVLSVKIIESDSGQQLLDVRRRVCWKLRYPGGRACAKEPCAGWSADLSPE